jgi:hypothetical protein
MNSEGLVRLSVSHQRTQEDKSNGYRAGRNIKFETNNGTFRNKFSVVFGCWVSPAQQASKGSFGVRPPRLPFHLIAKQKSACGR